MLNMLHPYNESTIDKHAIWLERQDYARRYRPARILDVGGGEKPLRCATHIVDMIPHKKRRADEGRGETAEQFTKDTWIRRDVNETPWPFRAGYFDYVWCSQMIEDIRDPIAVCTEMQRIGRRGFISTVQRQYESSVVQEDGVVGYHHHRWLIEVDEEQNELLFTFKSPILHMDAAMRPPHDVAKHLLHIEWEQPFTARELIYNEGWRQRNALKKYLQEKRWEQ